MLPKIFVKSTKKKKVEKPVLFRLVQFNEEIQLVVVDEVGDDIGWGVVLSVTPGGQIELCGGLNEDVGLKVTPAGYVSVTKKLIGDKDVSK